MERIYLSPPYICGNERKYVQEAFDSNWIAPLGPNVAAFEREAADYAGSGHALAVSSGTAAIHLALRYYGVGPGDSVFCSDLTFAGSCNAIMYCHATPVFIDSEPDSLNMSPAALEAAFDRAARQGTMPKAVIIVDLYGQSADWDRLLPICRRYGVPVIEDAAEALGSVYKGRRCGTFGDVGIFSFNGNKIVTTSGGGMVVSDDGEAIAKMLFWATQARENELHYEHREYGFNYRMSNVCAGIGRGQLERLDHKMARRREIHARYAELLAAAPARLFSFTETCVPNYWMNVLLLSDDCAVTPHELCAEMDARNIEARPAWKPMHMQPVFASYPYFPGTPEVGPDVFRRGVCLPSGEALTGEDQTRIADIVLEVLR